MKDSEEKQAEGFTVNPDRSRQDRPGKRMQPYELWAVPD